MERLQVDGKFFHAGGRRVFLKMVTYGPFPSPRPEALESHLKEMEKVSAAGFNAIRLYEMPSLDLLDAAEECGLWVFAGLLWQYGFDFGSDSGLVSAAKLGLKEGLDECGDNPAFAGVFVANEIPSDMVRWVGVGKTRAVLEELIAQGRQQKPELLFAYSNFPTTEYLEPANADFTAMNVYLEDRAQFASYLPRLHNVAGDRPVLLSEVGCDSQSNGEGKQAEVLAWSVQEVLKHGIAGMTVYSWSDWWFSGGQVVGDWSFGLMNRSGQKKAALLTLSEALQAVDQPEDSLPDYEWPMFSVIVCTYNGAHRMDECLRAVCRMDYPRYEVIVVDDGSSDDLESVVRRYPQVRLLQVEHGGLSVARNRGAEAAKGEYLAYTDDDCQPDQAWLLWLADAFLKYNWDACGGPNLPPMPKDPSGADEVMVASAPGAPSHVLLDDLEAEHLPGCNLVVRKEVFEKIGGFSKKYRVAGDDVDFCWRLSAAGYRMGFCGSAFVWHRRRASLFRYLKQQFGYGKAEALLMGDHPDKFSNGGARWKGRVYAGGAMSAQSGDTIYHGWMGTAGYQQVSMLMQPRRPLPAVYNNLNLRCKLAMAELFQPIVRRWARWWFGPKWKRERSKKDQEFILVDRFSRINEYEAKWWSEDAGLSRLDVLNLLCRNGWSPIADETDWDAQRGEHRILIASEIHLTGVMILTRVEMTERSRGRMPVDLVDLLESLGLSRSLT